jgi:ABC-type nickel/cobalt efflux system permease component RcnA
MKKILILALAAFMLGIFLPSVEAQIATGAAIGQPGASAIIHKKHHRKHHRHRHHHHHHHRKVILILK